MVTHAWKIKLPVIFMYSPIWKHNSANSTSAEKNSANLANSSKQSISQKNLQSSSCLHNVAFEQLLYSSSGHSIGCNIHMTAYIGMLNDLKGDGLKGQTSHKRMLQLFFA